MSYKQRPYAITDGGTGAITISGAQAALGVAASTATMLLSGTQAMLASLNAGGFSVINLGTPVNATDAATKNYVDNLVNGLRTVGVRAATTLANITLAGGTPNTLDGVTLAVGDLILVKDQTTSSQNGIYAVQTTGSGSNGTWVRATNWTTSANYGLTVEAYIDSGSTNIGTGWILAIDPNNPPTIGTTSLTFTQDSSASATAGNGLTKAGNQLSVLANGTSIAVSGSGISVSASYAGGSSIVTVGTITTGTWNGTSIAVANGGTGATAAPGARSNLGAAPNTPSYWLSGSNSELSAGVIPSVSAGLTLTLATGAFGIDTTVVATSTNTLTMSNKTLTSPVINSPVINHKTSVKTTSYTLTATDDTVPFLITAASTATLPASGTIATGVRVTVKNKKGSTANLSIVTSGSDTGENSTFTSSTPLILVPGDSDDLSWDGTEWIIV